MAFSERDEEKLWHAVFGNGEPGMDEALRANTRTIADINDRVGRVQESVDALRLERQIATSKGEGRRELWNWVRFALGLIAVTLTILGGFTQLSDRQLDIVRQLQNLPPIPE